MCRDDEEKYLDLQSRMAAIAKWFFQLHGRCLSHLDGRNLVCVPIRIDLDHAKPFRSIAASVTDDFTALSETGICADGQGMTSHNFLLANALLSQHAPQKARRAWRLCQSIA